VRPWPLVDAVRTSLATAVGISVASHLAVYGLTPILSLHLVALGGTSAQVGLLFSVFSLVAVILRPMAGAWIDRQGVRRALFPGAALMVLASLGLQAAGGPPALIALMAGFGVGYGLVTMAAAVLAASAPAAQRGRSLSIYYLAAPVSMAAAAPLGLWLFREVGAGANFALVTLLRFSVSRPRPSVCRRARPPMARRRRTARRGCGAGARCRSPWCSWWRRWDRARSTRSCRSMPPHTARSGTSPGSSASTRAP
jgi:MFS family permease